MDTTPMRFVSGVGSSEASARVGRSSEKAIPGRPPTGPPVEDMLELSPAGLALSRADVPSPERFTRIRGLRDEVKAETFLTPERMDGTAAKLLDALGRSQHH